MMRFGEIVSTASLLMQVGEDVADNLVDRDGIVKEPHLFAALGTIFQKLDVGVVVLHSEYLEALSQSSFQQIFLRILEIDAGISVDEFPHLPKRVVRHFHGRGGTERLRYGCL